jgi:hypothetical protein
MFKSLLLLSSLLFSQYSFADQAFEKIVTVEVTEINGFNSSVELPKVPKNPIDEIAIMIDSLIAIGKKIWPIIEAGRPVITNGLIPAISILPHMEGNNGVLYQMANWSFPTAKSYRLSYKNIYGFEVIGFTYTIYFQYAGSLNGVGKYLTSLSVQASDIYAAWGGFKFNVTSELVSIANVGTQNSPIASGIIKVNCIAKSILNEDQSSQSFYVDGNGGFAIIK